MFSFSGPRLSANWAPSGVWLTTAPTLRPAPGFFRPDRSAMLFNSVIFLFAFLPVCYSVFWTLKTSRARYVWLTGTGYVFYGYWDWR